MIIRTKINSSSTFTELLKEVNETMIEALSYEDYPYEELYDIISKKYNLKVESLFSIMLNYMPYQNNNKDQYKNVIDGLGISFYKNQELPPKYDLTFYVGEGLDDIKINMVYRKELFEEYIMDRISKALKEINRIAMEKENIVIENINYIDVPQEDEDNITFDDYFENEEFLVN